MVYCSKSGCGHKRFRLQTLQCPPPPLSSSSYTYDGVYIKIPFSTFEMRNQTSMRLQLFYHMDQFHLLSAIVDCHFRSLDSKQHVHPSQWATAVLSFLSAHSQSEIIFNWSITIFSCMLFSAYAYISTGRKLALNSKMRLTKKYLHSSKHACLWACLRGVVSRSIICAARYYTPMCSKWNSLL